MSSSQLISEEEKVKINVADKEIAKLAFSKIEQIGADMDQIFFYENPTNDTWCRDYGPAFLVNKDPSKPKILVDWEYNAWGQKYLPFNFDNQIPSRLGVQLNVQGAQSGIVMEGGFRWILTGWGRCLPQLHAY